MSKNKTIFYKKLIINYHILMLSLILGFNIIIFGNIESRNNKYAQETNFNMIRSVEQRLYSLESASISFINNLYVDDKILEDMLYFLNNNITDYLKNKLDTFYNSEENYYKGVENLVRTTLNGHESLQNIRITSYKTGTVYLFGRQSTINIEQLSNEELIKMAENDSIIEYDDVSYKRNIYNPFSLKIEGNIEFLINEDKITELVNSYTTGNRCIIVQENGLVIYDSEYKDLESYREVFDLREMRDSENVNIIKADEGLTIIGTWKEPNIIHKDYTYIFLINIVLIIVAEFFILRKFTKLNDRLNIILNTMKSIKNDGKITRIPQVGQEEKDEIAMICENFNKMCDDLEKHIDRYYVSQVNEKNMEIKLLQSYINPHFLYNTLEVIRMKAITNGDKDVARMIYLLAHLFRSQLKEKDIITIKSELEFCEKFLEIYRFRYNGKIDYNIQCEEGLLEQETIKFVLQPLLENYFVHGIGLENNNNRIDIKVKRVLNYINIVIQDNGKGIPYEKLSTLKEKIKNKESDQQMVGILNVNQRIKMIYGDDYGLFIESENEKGTRIVIKLPYMEKEQYNV